MDGSVDEEVSMYIRYQTKLNKKINLVRSILSFLLFKTRETIIKSNQIKADNTRQKPKILN